MSHLDRPDVHERYASAIATGTDLDVLIAAGWCREGLGVALWRLMAQFDQVRNAQTHGESIRRQRVAEISRLRATISVVDELEANRTRAELLVMSRVSEHDATAERLEVLLRLSSLESAKSMAGAYALKQATLRRFMAPDEAVLAISGRALDAWLDPGCRVCEGRGFYGGYGVPKIICHACHGSGSRRVNLSKHDDGRDFGRFLLTQFERKTENVARSMVRFLRRFGADPEHDPQPQIELRQRLSLMRSAQAEAD